MKCFNCGHDNEENKFCIKCGTKIKTTIDIPMSIEQEKVQKQKNNKNLVKLILITIAILLVVTSLFLLVKNLFFKSLNSDLSRVFDPNNLILIEENDLYGYINSSGKKVIEPKYNKANAFYGDYTLVAVKSETSSTGFEYQIINKQGNVKYKTENVYDIDYISEYNLWIIENVLYDSQMKQITTNDMYVNYEEYGYFTYEDYENNTSGVIDSNGKIIFKWNHKSISMDIAETYTDEYYAEIESYNEKSIVISLQTGKVLYENSNISQYNVRSLENNLFKLYDRSSYNTVDYLWFKDEKLAFQLNEDAYNVELKDQNTLEIDYGYNYDGKYNKEQRIYYYDYKTNKIIDKLPDTTIEDKKIVLNGYTEFTCSNKKGLMKDEKIILPCEYDDIEYINKYVYEYLKTSKKMDLIIVSLNKEFYLYDLNRKSKLYKFDVTKMYNINTSASTFILSENSENKQTVYNILSNKNLSFDKNSNIEIYANYITVEENNKIIYYNTKLEKIYEN